MNFIKKIFDGKVDESVHLQFTRFGKGEYGGRFVVSFWKTKKIKVKTSFEFANDLVRLCSEFGKCKVSGIVLSKNDISGIMSENNIEGDSKAKRSGLFYQNDIVSQELNGEQLKVLERESYFVLLDLEGEDFKLNIKKKLPKPGKSEKKIDGGFCKLEVDEKFYSKIKEDFFWDVPEGRKMNLAHKVIVNEIVMPKGEKDFAKIRELAKRKGKIIREGNVDGKEVRNEVEFSA